MGSILPGFSTPPQQLSYYEDFRSRSDIVGETKENSPVVKIQDKSGPLRLLHLDSFMPVTAPVGVDPSSGRTTRQLRDPLIYWEAAGLLAMIHFNERDINENSLIHGLKDRLQSCNLRLTMRLHDTEFSAITASRQLYPLIFEREDRHSLQSPMPGGIVGGIVTPVARSLASLAGLTSTPIVSGGASSTIFDTQHSNYPTFARTMPSAPAYARAVVQLLQHWGVTHVGCVFVPPDYGVSFLEELAAATSEHGIALTVASYREDARGFPLDGEVMAALDTVRDLRYIVMVNNGRTHHVLVPALRAGMVSEKHMWMLVPGVGVSQPTFTLPRSQENYARALDGAAVVDISIGPNPAFVQELASFKFNRALQSFYNQSHADPTILNTFNWSESIPIITSFAYTTYDAVMAMGIAACEQDNEFFTGEQYYQQITKTKFDGLSGKVNFDSLTGTRRFGGAKFGFWNILVDDEASTDDTIRFKSRLSLVLDTAANGTETTSQSFRVMTPFVFHGGGTSPPDSLPLLEVDQQLIPRAVRFLGWSLGGIAMLLAFCFGLFTLVRRKRKIVRMSQPIFLGMICVGTFLMAASVFFMGWQEPMPHLDLACILSPWLLVLGFSTAFSAVFAKAWRINRLFQSAAHMNRVQVQAKDVIWPFLLLTITNVTILTTWTLVAPPHWSRSDDELRVDQFGRSTHSLGRCVSGHRVFWFLLGGFNFVMVLFANYQSYLGRNIPSEFSESYYVALSMASLMECYLIGGPLLYISVGHPDVDFILKSVLVAFGCASILLPIFLHKFRTREQPRGSVVSSLSLAWSSERQRSYKNVPSVSPHESRESSTDLMERIQQVRRESREFRPNRGHRVSYQGRPLQFAGI